MAGADDKTTDDQTTEQAGDQETATDFSFLPEDVRGEDGGLKPDALKTHFEDLSAFKARHEEAQAELPQDADGYDFSLPEDLQLPEGFDPEKMKTEDDDGNEIAFDPASMIDKDDPDIPVLKEAMLKHGAKPGLMKDLAGILVNREIRQLMQAAANAEAEKAKLGSTFEARRNVVDRTVRSRAPKAQAEAILNSITSADALKGFEALLGSTKSPVSPGDSKPNLAEMSIDDRIMLGLKQRTKSA